MEKIQVSDQLRDDYKQLIQTAQNVESTIGSAYCKINKMVEVRKQIDIDLKAWWDKISIEYNIDKSKDYFIDQDGMVNLVDKPVAPEAPTVVKDAPPVEEAPEDNKEGGSTADLT